MHLIKGLEFAAGKIRVLNVAVLHVCAYTYVFNGSRVGHATGQHRQKL